MVLQALSNLHAEALQGEQIDDRQQAQSHAIQQLV